MAPEDNAQLPGLNNINPEAPDFAKDIKGKKSLSPLNIDYQYIPKNPYSLNGNDVDYSSDPNVHGIQEKSGFFETAKAEAKNLNVLYQAGHAGYEKYEQVNPLDDQSPAGWSPKSDVSKFVNIRPQNLSYLLASTGPKDQEYRFQRVLDEQANEDILANGSFTAKLVGGIVGVITDPTSYIPIAGWAKYGKLGSGFLKNAARAAPGALAYGALSSAAEQANKVNGNMADFATDSFTRTVFASALFGAGGFIASYAERGALWEARDLAKNHFDGIDYKLKMDADGKITGIEAHDSTGSLSAAKVSLAQDLANSTFNKSGLFKIPSAILNTPIIKPIASKISELPYAKAAGDAISNGAYQFYKYFGSELPLLLNSPFEAVRGFVDRAVDHGIQTTGLAEGKMAPVRFQFLMNKTFANLRSLSVQMDAMHLERNGFDIANRALGGVTDVGLDLYSKSLELLGKDVDHVGYIAREQFDDEVEQVLRTKQASAHAPVNDAANMMRKHMDETYKSFREAYNLPKDWLPPRTAEAYLMRVYNTPYMNVNLDKWVGTISDWLAEADKTINIHLAPIKDIEKRISQKTEEHKALIEKTNVTDAEQKASANELIAMKARLIALNNNLQNQLRTNPELQIHVDDWNALSADEAEQIESLTKRQRIIQREIEKKNKLIKGIKEQAAKREAGAMKGKTVKTAKGNKRKAETGKLLLPKEEADLHELEIELDDELQKLQRQMQEGKIDSRLYYKKKDSFQYELRDAKDRLKFRDVYEEGSLANPNIHRKIAAKAYYDTILNQTPEETINQIMGKFTGNKSENPIRQRTLLVPDEILYANGFMSKDLMAKVSNYTSYLSRKTHLKTAFNEISLDNGIERILEEVNSNYQTFHGSLNTNKTELENKLKTPDLNPLEKKKIEKQIKSVEKEIVSKTKRFEADKKSLQHLYEKMMGIRKYEKGWEQFRSIVMSMTSASSLAFVPFTQINDLSAIALQHGVWPLVRDAMYPLVQSLFGLLKTGDSEAFRNTAPSIHLALQDVGMGYADRNWGMQTNPYLNLGRTVNAIEKIAHISSNFTLTNYIDNYLQRLSAAATQSELMRILFAAKNGTMSKRDSLYIRKYGIDPEKWKERMIAAFEKDGGGKTSLGGYQSLHYKWQDLEAANVFGDAIFKGVKDTQIQAGLADSPFWTDNPIGSIIKGFGGWGYASVNRYLIPAMQQPDASKLLGILCMLGTGALIDPMRRMAKGDEPYPANITDKQIMWAAFNNSGVFSEIANFLSNANLLTGDKLLGNLRNDKYKDRTRAGLLGPAWGQFNRIADVTEAAASGEWNKADMQKAARMLPFANASWMYWLSKKVVDGMDIPATRREAHALRESNQ